MSNICIFKSKSHRSDKSLMFWRLSGKILSHKANFVDSSFPTFSLSFSRSDNLKHFSLSHWLYFFNRYIPFSCFLFAFLFHHVSQDFWVSLLLSVHKIGWDCALFDILNSAFCILLFVLFDSLFHLYFLFESFLIEYFSFDAS